MPGRSTIDQIFALRQIIEKCNEHNRTLYIAFVDFKAAFDSIDRISLWDLIRISDTPPKLCRLLELLYSDSESCVRVGNDLSEWFSLHPASAKVVCCPRPLQLCHWSSYVPTENCCWTLTWHWSWQLASHRHGLRRWHCAILTLLWRPVICIAHLKQRSSQSWDVDQLD